MLVLDAVVENVTRTRVVFTLWRLGVDVIWFLRLRRLLIWAQFTFFDDEYFVIGLNDKFTSFVLLMVTVQNNSSFWHNFIKLQFINPVIKALERRSLHLFVVILVASLWRPCLL